MHPKILIIRFSSFGDIIQCLACVNPLKTRFPNSQLHWTTKSDFKDVVSSHPGVDKVWELGGARGLIELFKLAKNLRNENFDFIYDAHSNLRSTLLTIYLKLFSKTNFLKRPKERLKRFALFYLGKNFFPIPYRGMKSYLKPLEKWGVEQKTLPCKLKLPEISPKFKSFISLVPSAAWEMKRWPLGHFKKLICNLSHENFVVLGGPADTFCQELENIDPSRVQNMAGKLSLMESMAVVKNSKIIVSADTGIIHVADLIGVKGLSLIGPTAFGFSTGEHIKTLEVSLPCRPCSKDGRGKCSQKVYQKCMVDIRPEMVAKNIK
ncbi:MAG: glycosyltransferase family 9 protein [Epsilonproteobacteria bacterium]|nr:MAG: glycosyltransferase family 9 protein [Campylobacterota bacterium]RLA67780.1 MAG: glycosyltransferase family 9 protein [Campylobacterota bacterium]